MSMKPHFIHLLWMLPRAEFYDRMHRVAMPLRFDRWDANAKLPLKRRVT